MPRNLFRDRRMSRASRSRHNEEQFNRRVMAEAVYETADNLQEQEAALFTDADGAKLSKMLNTGGSIEIGKMLEALQTATGRAELKAHLDKLPPADPRDVTITLPGVQQTATNDPQVVQQADTVIPTVVQQDIPVVTQVVQNAAPIPLPIVQYTVTPPVVQQAIPIVPQMVQNGAPIPPPQPPVVVTNANSSPIDFSSAITRKSPRITKTPDRLEPTEIPEDDHDNVGSDREDDETMEDFIAESTAKLAAPAAKFKELTAAEKAKVQKMIDRILKKKRNQNERAKINLAAKRKIEEDNEEELMQIATAMIVTKKAKAD